MSWSYASLIQEMNALAPFEVKEVSWDGISLAIVGDGWSFATTSPWRFSDAGKYLFGSEDTSLAPVTCLEQKAISHFHYALDLEFEFSDTSKLSVFCCTNNEAWIFRAKGMSATVVYIANADDNSESPTQS